MFDVEFAPGALADLGWLKTAAQNVVLDAVEEQLTKEPLTTTRNRKPLRPKSLSSWEMRVGSHRVFYDVDEPNRKVLVKAVGWKEHNMLFISGEEYPL